MDYTQQNTMIANFMGWKFAGYSRKGFMGWFGVKQPHYLKPGQQKSVWAIRYYDSFFSYDISWNWLMEVVEKIESLGFQFFIHNEGSYIRKWFWRGNVPDMGNIGLSKMHGTYLTVVQFITWYNNQPKTQP